MLGGKSTETFCLPETFKAEFQTVQSHSKHEGRGELSAPGFTWTVLDAHSPKDGSRVLHTGYVMSFCLGGL